MSVSFNWDFEEEEPDPSSRHEGLSISSKPRQRRWPLLIITLLTLSVMGGLAARIWVNNRLSAIEKIEAKLGEIVELELQNIADGDVDLFRALQDPTVFRWQEQQVARYISSSGGFAPAPGLVPADRPPEVGQARVVGRTGRVELVYWFQLLQPAEATDPPNPSMARWFQSVPSEEATNPTRPLPFHVTWFYRLDENGTWYHTAPPGSHTGIPYSWHGARLDVRATEVEAEALQPVAVNLTSLVLGGCQLIGCGQDHYTLSLEDVPGPQVHGNRWSLPAPHLSGIPADQAARDAWQHATKLWLTEALAQSRAGVGVSDRVIYRHLVTRLQAELELTEPPTPDIEVLAQALSEGQRHALQSLWEAEYNPDDPQGNHLLDAEVIALLQWIEDQVGTARLLELLPALGNYQRLDNALLTLYRMMLLDFEAEWFNYLFELTGKPPLPPTALQAPYQALVPPPVPRRPQTLPGDEIALNCDSRVWVSNADGSNRVALTTANQHFNGLYWSPDGRWLLTAWWHGSEGSALYLLAADGSGGRLLTNNPLLYVFPAGWSPDSQQAIYQVYRGPEAGGEAEVWTTDVRTGATRRLPGLPRWSPDGGRLVYGAESSDAQGGAIWLADANWENARLIAERAQLGPAGETWSPDGSKLALTLVNDDPSQSAVVLYDLATASITPLITMADLAGITLSSTQAAGDGGQVDYITHEADPIARADEPLQSLWSLGWSADGSRLIVWSQATTEMLSVIVPTVVAVVPLDGSSPRVLAYGDGGFYGNTVWSPTDPDRLTFAWPTGPRLSGIASYLFDMDAGLVYTSTQTWHTAWSPDGAWLAFAGQNPVTIVDRAGHARFAPGGNDSCSAIAWNPVADLDGLGQPIALALTSSKDDWGFGNVHMYRDQVNQSLHVWGQLTNHTGSDQCIVSLIPFIRDSEGNPINSGQADPILPGYRELIQTISLADGRSLPFNLTFHLPNDVELEDDAEVVVHVATVPDEPTRDDLDVSGGELDLSGWPEALYVRGAWENPGPDLEEYVTIVVTLYGDQGQVLGWGWRSDTARTRLASGTFNFIVEIALSETVTDVDQIVSYKVQLFAH